MYKKFVILLKYQFALFEVERFQISKQEGFDL